MIIIKSEFLLYSATIRHWLNNQEIISTQPQRHSSTCLNIYSTFKTLIKTTKNLRLVASFSSAVRNKGKIPCGFNNSNHDEMTRKITTITKPTYQSAQLFLYLFSIIAQDYHDSLNIIFRFKHELKEYSRSSCECQTVDCNDGDNPGNHWLLCRLVARHISQLHPPVICG